MSKRIIKRSILSLLISFALLVGACSGGGEGKKGASSTEKKKEAEKHHNSSKDTSKAGSITYIREDGSDSIIDTITIQRSKRDKSCKGKDERLKAIVKKEFDGATDVRSKKHIIKKIDTSFCKKDTIFLKLTVSSNYPHKKWLMMFSRYIGSKSISFFTKETVFKTTCYLGNEDNARLVSKISRRVILDAIKIYKKNSLRKRFVAKTLRNIDTRTMAAYDKYLDRAMRNGVISHGGNFINILFDVSVRSKHYEEAMRSLTFLIESLKYEAKSETRVNEYFYDSQINFLKEIKKLAVKENGSFKENINKKDSSLSNSKIF